MLSRFSVSSQPEKVSSKRSFIRRSLSKLMMRSAKKMVEPTIGPPLEIEYNSVFTTRINPEYSSPSSGNTEYISSPVSPPDVNDVPEFDVSPGNGHGYEPYTHADGDVDQAQASPDIASPLSRRSFYGEIFRKELPISLLDTDEDEFEDHQGLSPKADTPSHMLDDGMNRASLITCESEKEETTNVQAPAPQEPMAAKLNTSNVPSTEAMGRTAGYVNPISAHTKKPRCDPINKARRDIAAMEGGEAVFTVAMDFIMSKLVVAMNEPDSAYLFRDFAGHFTSFLDRFGPGGYDSHRAPREISWMLKLILPWMYIENSASDTRITIYEEVNGWIRNITHFFGSRSSHFLLEEGTWDSCVEHMASPNYRIAETAYHTAKVIVSSLPFGYELVCKVLLMRNVTFGYEEEEMSLFRNNHIRLLSRMVERIDSTKTLKLANDYSMCLAEIVGELERLSVIETDSRVYAGIEKCLSYTTEVYKSLDSLLMNSPSTMAHEIMSSTNLQSPRLILDSSLSSSPARSFKDRYGEHSVASVASVSTHRHGNAWSLSSKSVGNPFSRTRNSFRPRHTEGHAVDTDSRSVYSTASTRSRVSRHVRTFFSRRSKHPYSAAWHQDSASVKSVPASGFY